MITTQNEIIKEMSEYYENLYKSKVKHLQHINVFLDERNIKSMDLEKQNICEGPITIDEIKYVLKKSKNNKSPGTDGIPGEFYKVFLNDISPFLLRSYQEGYLKGNLSITQKQGIITCIPKGSKPKQYIQNWRPITLLNMDYKLLSGALAHRMKIFY